MQLACSSSIRPCPKIAQVGTMWKAAHATFAWPSPALKQPRMQRPLVAAGQLNPRKWVLAQCTQNWEMGEGKDDHVAKEKADKDDDDKVVEDGQKMMENEHKAMDTVLVLHTAIKNRNLRELSDVIAEECRFVCNSISSLTAFQGKKQVLEFFSSLMKIMGENIEFVIQPSPRGGMNVSVKWSLVLNETNVPLGKGYSFYTCHTYQGKAVIKDVHMFIEPFFQMQPSQWKIFAFLLPIFHRISPPDVAKNKLAKSLMYCFLTVVFLTTLFTIVKHILF